MEATIHRYRACKESRIAVLKSPTHNVMLDSRILFYIMPSPKLSFKTFISNFDFPLLSNLLFSLRHTSPVDARVTKLSHGKSDPL